LLPVSVATIAINIAKEDNIFPLTAVAGELSCFNPNINSAAEAT